MSSWRKMGGFLIGLGIFLLILFVISDSVQQADFGLLAGGAGCLGLGIFFNITHPAPAPPPSPRFRILKGRKNEPQPKKEPQAKPAGAPVGPPSGGGGKPAGGPAKGAAPAKGGPPPKGGGKPGKK